MARQPFRVLTLVQSPATAARVDLRDTLDRVLVAECVMEDVMRRPLPADIAILPPSDRHTELMFNIGESSHVIVERFAV